MIPYFGLILRDIEKDNEFRLNKQQREFLYDFFSPFKFAYEDSIEKWKKLPFSADEFYDLWLTLNRRLSTIIQTESKYPEHIAEAKKSEKPKFRKLKQAKINEKTKIPRIPDLEKRGIDQRFYNARAQYWKLFPKCLKPKKREKYKAQSPLNNLLNLGYEILKGEVYKAILAAHLDPYLGYLHSIQFAKPSLVCDIQEIFRALIEDFLVTYHQKLEPERFEQKGKRSFLNPEEKLKLIIEINCLLKRRIPYKRREYSKKATIRTIIKEETIKLAQYLRENRNYEPVMRAPIFLKV